MVNMAVVMRKVVRRKCQAHGPITVSLYAFYFCRLIGKPTAFLQLQELSTRNKPCESTLTSTAHLSLHAHTLTPPTHKPLACSRLRSFQVPPSPAPSSVCEASTSSGFRSLSLITPTPFRSSPLALAFSAIIHNNYHRAAFHCALV